MILLNIEAPVLIALMLLTGITTGMAGLVITSNSRKIKNLKGEIEDYKRVLSHRDEEMEARKKDHESLVQMHNIFINNYAELEQRNRQQAEINTDLANSLAKMHASKSVSVVEPVLDGVPLLNTEPAIPLEEVPKAAIANVVESVRKYVTQKEHDELSPTPNKDAYLLKQQFESLTPEEQALVLEEIKQL